jgi:hypothetical protein
MNEYGGARGEVISLHNIYSKAVKRSEKIFTGVSTVLK